MNNHFRLDPKLEIEKIPLDDIDSMLALSSQLKRCIMDDHDFREQIRQCAWRLIASNWYCHLAPASKRSDDVKRLVVVEIRSRNEKNSRLIADSCPNTYFSIQPNQYLLPLASDHRVFTLAVDDENTMVNIELIDSQRRSPISGLLMTCGRLIGLLCPQILPRSRKRRIGGHATFGRASKQSKHSKSY